MAGIRVLISGAGIAGPSLAYWLNKCGFDVTVVERAPTLREGGQAVDFRGPIHREVLERMSLWEPIHRHRTKASDVVLLDRAGHPRVTLPSLMMSGDVEILRGDLSRLLHERTVHSASYRFDEQITALRQSSDGVVVDFRRGKSEHFDLVVGADGLHSGVRALAFGDESQFLVHHGYQLATFSLPDVLDLRGRAMTYTVPRRSVTVRSEGGGRARASFIFAGGAPHNQRGSAANSRQTLRDAYHGVGWEVPRLLSHIDDAADLYTDEIASVSLDRYSTGRVVLLGDAAYGGTLGGQGTPLAVVGAYVLAGELTSGDGDVLTALSRYETRMRPYAIAGQKGAANVGPFFAPKTSYGLLLRDLFYRAMTSRVLIRQFEKLVTSSASDFVLPAYASLQPRTLQRAASNSEVIEQGIATTMTSRPRCSAIADPHAGSARL